MSTRDSMLTMYAIKRELKLNNFEKSVLAGCAGFSRFVYNHGLSLLQATWDIPEISGSDSKRLDAIKKVFTNITKKQLKDWLASRKCASVIKLRRFLEKISTQLDSIEECFVLNVLTLLSDSFSTYSSGFVGSGVTTLKE